MSLTKAFLTIMLNFFLRDLGERKLEIHKQGEQGQNGAREESKTAAPVTVGYSDRKSQTPVWVFQMGSLS